MDSTPKEDIDGDAIGHGLMLVCLLGLFSAAGLRLPGVV